VKYTTAGIIFLFVSLIVFNSSVVQGQELKKITELYPKDISYNSFSDIDNELCNNIPVYEDRSLSPQSGQSTGSLIIGISPESSSGIVEHLELCFHDTCIELHGPGNTFPPGMFIRYDFIGVNEILETIPVDYWDSITLVLPGDGDLSIAYVKITHNNSVMLQWTGLMELSSAGQTHWNLAQAINNTKLDNLSTLPNGKAYWALQEIGKNDGTKYSETSPGGWCSEFTAWVFRHNGWPAPQGSIGSQHMRAFFSDRNRLYTIQQIYDGEYVLQMGDYMSMFNEGHSGIFLEYIDSPDQPEPSTRILTIEGGSLVSIFIRQLSALDHAGNAQ